MEAVLGQRKGGKPVFSIYLQRRVKQQKSRKNGLPDIRTYFNRVETCCIVAARFDSCIGDATENTPGLYEPAKFEGDPILRLRWDCKNMENPTCTRRMAR